MKRLLKILLFVIFPFLLNAQQNLDSLKYASAHAANDSLRYHACWDLYNYYEEVNKDSAFFYADLELALAKKNNKPLAQMLALIQKGYQLLGMGRYAESLQCLLSAFAM